MKKKVYIETRTPKLPKLYTELIVNYLFFLKIIIKSSNTFSVFVMQFYTKKKKNYLRAKFRLTHIWMHIFLDSMLKNGYG